MADHVKEAPYCVVCRRSSDVKWRKHLFSRKHQQATHQFLELQANRVAALVDDNWALPVASWTSWRCVFCASSIPRADALTHVGSNLHRKRVADFCRQYRCDGDRKMRNKLWNQMMQQSREVETIVGDTSKPDDHVQQEKMEHCQVKDTTNGRIAAFLSSATSRLQEVETERRGRNVDGSRAVPSIAASVTPAAHQKLYEVVSGPLEGAMGTRNCKTVVSADGVLQNPIGRHEGRRVWGGGIVKLRKTEWITWSIDQLVKEEQSAQPAATQLTEPSGHVFTHRVTELAQSQGCSSIVSVSWGASVGNVHSAAVPPWMVQTEEEYKQCNRRDQVASVSGLVTCQQPRKRRMADGKRRDIFTELESKSEYGPDWLPNFGGVWQEGSRFKSKQAFRKAADMERYASSQDRPYPSMYSLSDLPKQPRSPRVTPAVAQMGQCLSPRRPAVQQQSVVEVQQENLLAPASETAAQNAKNASALDVKKQLLMAQKERLRAKMAARKRSY